MRCSLGGIDPWFALDAILEPAIGSSNSNVENQIEVLVKRTGGSAAGPWVVDSRTVGVRGGKVAFAPEGLVEVDVHDLEKTSVDVAKDVLGAPF